NVVYLNEKDTSSVHLNGNTKVPVSRLKPVSVGGGIYTNEANIGYVPGINTSSVHPVRFWIGCFNEPTLAYQALVAIQKNFNTTNLQAFNFFPSDMSGFNDWSKNFQTYNLFGRYLVLRIIIYTNPNLAGKYANPWKGIYNDKDENNNKDLGIIPAPPVTAIHAYGTRNDGSMTPRITGLTADYMEYNPVIRLNRIEPAEANDGSDYNNWEPMIFGFGTHEIWDFNADSWANGTPTSELYINHKPGN
ncbi:MAG: hypothetical protein PHW04_18010, partial [Candidatus Wallbacteria bacterium]|nr:hypothetical protein [Candidatus Wallbacteria bacterium]